MQALVRSACVYATFEEMWLNLENQKSEGDALYAEAKKVIDELTRAQQHQTPCQDEVKGCRESPDASSTRPARTGCLVHMMTATPSVILPASYTRHRRSPQTKPPDFVDSWRRASSKVWSAWHGLHWWIPFIGVTTDSVCIQFLLLPASLILYYWFQTQSSMPCLSSWPSTGPVHVSCLAPNSTFFQSFSLIPFCFAETPDRVSLLWPSASSWRCPHESVLKFWSCCGFNSRHRGHQMRRRDVDLENCPTNQDGTMIRP